VQACLDGHTLALTTATAKEALQRQLSGRSPDAARNGAFLFGDKGTPAEYRTGLELALARGWLELHDCGT
jgi:hypothetical protein